MVYVVLYQTGHQLFISNTVTHRRFALIVYWFAPLFFRELADDTVQIYVHQLQIIDIVLPFLLVGRAGFGPVAAHGLAGFFSVQAIHDFFGPAKHVEHDPGDGVRRAGWFFERSFEGDAFDNGIYVVAMPGVAGEDRLELVLEPFGCCHKYILSEPEFMEFKNYQNSINS